MAAATPKVELVYDPDCPNVDRARERLRQAIGERGVAADHPAGRSCRLYDQGNGTLGPAPPFAVIIAALRIGGGWPIAHSCLGPGCEPFQLICVTLWEAERLHKAEVNQIKPATGT